MEKKYLIYKSNVFFQGLIILKSFSASFSEIVESTAYKSGYHWHIYFQALYTENSILLEWQY